MPCSDGQDRDRIEYKDGHDPYYEQLCRDMKARNDVLADLLCKAGRARKNKTDIPVEVLRWWDQHCALDRSRGEPW